MADVHDKRTRSYNMSQIRSKNTRPEMIVRKFLFSKGFRYRIHDKRLPGKPDIVLPKHKTVIFVHGCFWHGHEGCKFFILPETKKEWWKAKIMKTKSNDTYKKATLSDEGWKVITVWECELKTENRTNTLVELFNSLICL